MGDTVLRGIIGRSADRRVILGFAPAQSLYAHSFADVLDERTGRGYQRRFNSQHSLDFRRYIQAQGSATIPLTFNLRPDDGGWMMTEEPDGAVMVRITDGARPLVQVDCQHRLGYLNSVDLGLPFMCFIGLTEREEMEVFSVINGKARGLSRSLLDFHAARLCDDLGAERPELLIALFLKNEASSPWHNRLDLGGSKVSGMDRRASLRTMQKAARHFLRKLRPAHKASAEEAARLALEFWIAMERVVPQAFENVRAHLVTKGIGVYALMQLAAELVNEQPEGVTIDADLFTATLADFAPQFDWTNSGPLKGLGGEGGATAALQLIREARRRSHLRVAHG